MGIRGQEGERGGGSAVAPRAVLVLQVDFRTQDSYTEPQVDFRTQDSYTEALGMRE